MRRERDWDRFDWLALGIAALLSLCVLGAFVASDRDGKLALTHVVQGWAGK